MGSKVQLDNYYSMRDLNCDLNGTSWPSCSGENNLPNGQYYYGVLPRPNPDLFPGVDKDLLKQKMLEHETVFKNQVYELHRLYRVQRDLMDESKKKDEFKHRTFCETSSSSSPMASHTTPEDPHRRTSFFGCPPVSGPEFIGSSSAGVRSHKGKNVQGGCASPRNSEVSESRPTKVRRMIDLQLPADEYVDIDEVEQRENTKYQEIASKPSTCLRKPNAIADLNEPPEIEETTACASVNFLNRTQSNSCYIDKGNGESWFSSMLKAGGTNQANHFEKEPLHLRPVQAVFENSHQPSGFFPHHLVKEDPWPGKANDGFNVFNRSHRLSSFSNSQPPSYGTSSNLVNSWDPSHGKLNGYQTQKPISVQTTPFQSSAQSNGSLEAWWQRNADPRHNPGYGTKTPVQNGFYYGSSSGDHNKAPSQISKVSLNYVNGSYNDKAASGSGDLLRGKNSFDLNSTVDLNLNEEIPNGLSDESLAPQPEPKQEDCVSVLPWLRAKPSNNESTSSRNCPNRNEVRKALDHQDSVASTSYNADDTKGKKKLFLDINVACEDPEDCETAALIEDEKMETEHPNGFRNMFDLNSCLTEDEIPSTTSLTNRSTITNDSKGPERFVIDLEAPVNLEDDDEDEEITDLVADKEPAETLARVAAEAIVTISSFIPENRVTVSPNVTENRVESESASSEDDALRWFVDVVCSCSDEVKSCPDDFEEMTLKLTECTVEEYFPNPPVFDFQAVEETGPGSGTVSVTGRARRGPARRGRQKRDFQRDILPGLGSLARHEVSEDLQTFGGLMRATGHAWQCGTRTGRNGSRRGRRKAVAAIPLPPPPPEIDTTTTTFASQPKNGEITVLEDRSLTSWGKTTRRPRRQRCPAAAPGNSEPIALT